MRSAAMARWKKKSTENMWRKYGANSPRGGFSGGPPLDDFTVASLGTPSIDRPNRSAFSSSRSDDQRIGDMLRVRQRFRLPEASVKPA